MFHDYLYVYTMFILEKEYEEVYTFFFAPAPLYQIICKSIFRILTNNPTIHMFNYI